MNITFFTETGEGIGYGHLIRCEALLNAFATRNLTSNVCIYVKDWANFEYPNATFLNWTDDSATIPSGEIAIVDSYLSQEKSLKRIADRYKYTVVIDDFNRVPYPFNLIVNPNIHGSEIEYKNQIAAVISGNRYTILRPEFKTKRNEYTVRDEIKKIIITSGGSDYRQLIPKFTSFVEKYPEIDFIALSGKDEYADELNRKYDIPNLKILRKLDAISVINLFCNSDLVITAAGQTLNELAFLGIPSIAICIDYDQVNNIKSFYEREYIRKIINWDDTDLFEQIEDQISFMKPKSNRQHLSQIGQSLVDGCGADNLAEMILELYNKK